MEELHCEKCGRRLFDYDEKGIKIKCPRCGDYIEISYEALKKKAKDKN